MIIVEEARMDLGITDRVALVTGASSGIGEACAVALAVEGCLVVGTDISKDGLERLEARDPRRFRSVVADLADPEGPARAVARTVEHFGGIDILVCAGGVFGTARGGVFTAEAGSAASEISPDDWNHTLNVNLRGSFLAAQAAIPIMAKKHWGRVILISSVSGQMGGFGAGADYAASKAALGGMARSMALTAGPSGITINCVNPGMIESPMLLNNHDTSSTDKVAGQAAMRRLGQREEVAAMVTVLASEQAAYVTGTHLDINGGYYFG
jgi:3-oxoacyl-[acyl-carrier protein] reductase